MVKTQKIKLYAWILASALAIDFIRFYYTKNEGLVNWVSSIHTIWPLFSLALMFVVVIFYHKWKKIIYIPLTIHFTVVVLGYLNNYLNFSSVINYNCFMFNLVLFTLYFLA